MGGACNHGRGSNAPCPVQLTNPPRNGRKGEYSTNVREWIRLERFTMAMRQLHPIPPCRRIHKLKEVRVFRRTPHPHHSRGSGAGPVLSPPRTLIPPLIVAVHSAEPPSIHQPCVPSISSWLGEQPWPGRCPSNPETCMMTSAISRSAARISTRGLSPSTPYLPGRISTLRPRAILPAWVTRLGWIRLPNTVWQKSRVSIWGDSRRRPWTWPM